MTRRIALALLALVLAPAAAGAADYAPVTCTAAKPYAGPPRHAPVDLASLQPAGDLRGELDTATAGRLAAAFDKAFAATKAHAMTVAVAVPGRGIWTMQRGGRLFYWASTGKQATATIILQLAEEKRLNLSDPIARWIAGVPNGDVITIAQLLNHTSGLFSANEDLRIHRENRRLDADTELTVLQRHGAMACPGERWRYSNSGYALLGRVIERIEGRSLADVIASRIITPLGLQEMRVPTSTSSVADIAPPVSDTAEPAIDITVPGAAGPLAASARDMLLFQQAFLDGRLLKAATRARMLAEPYPMFEPGTFYGSGVMLYDIADASINWIGHSGGAPGVKAVSVYAPGQNAFTAVALTGDGSAEATANALLKALRGP
jgi:D-alanyl-D-alanine carboxypeptidase